MLLLKIKMFSYCASISILLSVFSVSQLTIYQETHGVISEPERVFSDLLSKNGTKENKLVKLFFPVCEKTDEKISEPELLFMEVKSENGTKKNKNFQLIFPGTRWCGDGDKAKNKEELGPFHETDACCREHDLCSDIIFSGESKHGLSNKGFFTRLDCSCDEKFYKCLSSLCSPLAASIGITYFDILRPSCFTYDFPVTCTQEKNHTFFGKRCLKEEADNTKPKIWHWRETKKFDLSATVQHLAKCFKDVTLEKMKTTEKAISKSLHEHVISLDQICSKLDPDSWYRRFCPKNITK